MPTIPLSQGQVAIVDPEDWAVLSGFRWQAHRKRPGVYYAVRNIRIGGRRTKIYMHNEIMRPPPGFEVDHWNHDTLDNRRRNLRICTHSEKHA